MKLFLPRPLLSAAALTLTWLLSGCSAIEPVAPTTTPQAVENRSARLAADQASLALRWAPIHYQDTDVTGSHGLSGKADYISAINFDGDWIATNNWNNIVNRPATAHCYYSVVETSTHWFIIYAFYHARDWTDIAFLYNIDEHENDLEGFLSVIKKDGSQYGSLQAIVTVAHSDFFSFVPSGSPLQANEENIDGTLTMELYNGQLRPATAQEAKGHGLKANPYYKINGDGIKYLPSLTGTSEAPSNADDRDVKYKLVDIFEPGGLWAQRFNTNLFVSPDGNFKKSVGDGSANAPWRWDDGNDRPAAGALAKDPAALIQAYFRNLGSFDLQYIDNKYR
ncbi:hypothetical protein ACFSUS_11590 [Spirosoma soli]|uniref:Lipoprotein n=1 Tax=Spirosoma soli TaxID=1770529 RepID=A0ABW5M3R4_9BACT